VYIGRSYQDSGGTYCLHLQEEAYTSVQGRQNTIRIRSEKMVNEALIKVALSMKEKG
jgi:hypothetical protein